MHPEVGKIREKTGTAPWPKYLKSVRITGLRGWNGQQVRFPFPVTVISGENGSGKSTVLKAAACAYTNSLPGANTYLAGTFFPDTPWETISDATLAFSMKHGEGDRNYQIRRATRRWRIPSSGRAERAIFWQDISRTLPKEATIGYGQIAKRTANEVAAEQLNDDFRKFYSSILGRAYDDARFATTDADENRRVGVVSLGDDDYSQFHQGAGEASSLDFMLLAQNIPTTALVLIDEVEASLHPRSQRRLMHFLLWVARRNHVQVIVSSHSPYVLDEVPPDARVFLARNGDDVEVVYGLSTEYSLNRMDDMDSPDLWVYCEDTEAVELAKELLRIAEPSIELERLKFMETGPADAVKALGRLAHNDRLPVRAVGVLDGDEAPGDGTIKLPGTFAPEVQVFTDILADGVPFLAARLSLVEGAVRSALERASTRDDHHDWPAEAARLLNNQTPSYLWITMCSVWVQHCVSEEEKQAFAEGIENLLP